MNVFPFPKCGRCFMPRFFIPLLHRECIRRLLSHVRPSGVPHPTLFLVCRFSGFRYPTAGGWSHFTIVPLLPARDGVAVDVAWQCTRTQQWLMQQWENCFFYGVRSEEVFSTESVPRLSSRETLMGLETRTYWPTNH
jgi:hypothetical protein